MGALNTWKMAANVRDVKPCLTCLQSRCSRGTGPDFHADPVAFFPLRPHEFVIELEMHPQAWGDSKETAQTQVIFWRATPLALFHPGEMRLGILWRPLCRQCFQSLGGTVIQFGNDGKGTFIEVLSQHSGRRGLQRREFRAVRSGAAGLVGFAAALAAGEGGQIAEQVAGLEAV